jgi:hypothetical protein
VDAVVGEREKPTTSNFSVFSNRPNFDLFAAAATNLKDRAEDDAKVLSQ